MYTDRETTYKISNDHMMEWWYIYIFDKIMELQQQRNPNNYVVFDYRDGDAVFMNNRGRGIDEFVGGVRLQHGCLKDLMKAAASEPSITIVIDVSFDNKAGNIEVLEQLCGRFTSSSAIPSDSNLYSQLLKKKVTAKITITTQSSLFLLQNIDPYQIVKKAINAKALHLVTYCETYKYDEKAIEGK